MRYIIKFCLDNQLMRQIQIESDSVGNAIKQAIDLNEGYIFWDSIKVEAF